MAFDRNQAEARIDQSKSEARNPKREHGERYRGCVHAYEVHTVAGASTEQHRVPYQQVLATRPSRGLPRTDSGAEHCSCYQRHEHPTELCDLQL
ncbi:hypothetical protein D3C76_1660010 [compost metagenome]